jgi:hypothetical protein
VSQALSTAAWIIGSLPGGMIAAGSRFMKTFNATRAAYSRIWSHDASPATIPSKSSG